MQAAAQRHIDSAVSKTVNAPNSQTVEETQQVYDLAYSKGLKSIAYYRDGSRDYQVQHDAANLDGTLACSASIPGDCD